MRSLARATALAGALAAWGCAGPRAVAPKPAARAGWVIHPVGGLQFEAPAAWRATGDERRITLEAPAGGARLEVSVTERPFPDERACLAASEAKLAERVSTLERARRHPTRLAGRPAQALEGDQGGWHVWAVAACDGGAQYRVFFTATTPASVEALEVWRTLLETARIAGASA